MTSKKKKKGTEDKAVIAGETYQDLSPFELDELEREPTYVDFDVNEDVVEDVPTQGGAHEKVKRYENMVTTELEVDDLEEISPPAVFQLTDALREVRSSIASLTLKEKHPPAERAPEGVKAEIPALVKPVSGQDDFDRLVNDSPSGEWYKTYFDEHYLMSLPHECSQRVSRQVAFVSEQLSLPYPSAILDLGCGTGDQLVALASMGYEMTGVDLSRPLLEKARSSVDKNELEVELLLGDMRQLDFNNRFNGVLILGFTFGYFDDRINLNVLKQVRRSLVPSGQLVLELLNRDRQVSVLPRVIWWRHQGRLYLDEVEFDFKRSRLQVKRTCIYEDGRPVKEDCWEIRCYSMHEVEAMLKMAGFEVLSYSGNYVTPGAFFPEHSESLIVHAGAI